MAEKRSSSLPATANGGALDSGRRPSEVATAIKVKIEQIVSAKITGAPLDSETAHWVADLDDVMADKLAAVHLVALRTRTTLGPFLDQYAKSRGDGKPSTRLVYATHAETSWSISARRSPCARSHPVMRTSGG